MIKKKTFNTHKIATYHKYELYFFLYGLSVVTTRLKRSHYFYIFQNSRTFKQAVQGGSKITDSQQIWTGSLKTFEFIIFII